MISLVDSDDNRLAENVCDSDGYYSETRLQGEEPRLQGRNEFLWGYVGLTQDACQRTHFYFAVHGDDTAIGTSAHNDMASGLTQLLESQAFQRPNHRSAGNPRKLRHALER